MAAICQMKNNSVMKKKGWKVKKKINSKGEAIFTYFKKYKGKMYFLAPLSLPLKLIDSQYLCGLFFFF